MNPARNHDAPPSLNGRETLEIVSRINAKEADFLTAYKRAADAMTISEFERIQLVSMLKASNIAAAGIAERFLEEFQWRFRRFMERDDRPTELNLVFSILAAIFHECKSTSSEPHRHQTNNVNHRRDVSLKSTKYDVEPQCSDGKCIIGRNDRCGHTKKIIREYARHRALVKSSRPHHPPPTRKR